MKQILIICCRQVSTGSSDGLNSAAGKTGGVDSGGVCLLCLFDQPAVNVILFKFYI